MAPSFPRPLRPSQRGAGPPLSAELRRALGFHYLIRFFSGETLTRLARTTHRDPKTIRKYMRTAAAGLIDAAQQTLLTETFPRMIKLLNAAIDQQLTMAAEGRPIDTALVERLLKGLYILDAPRELVRPDIHTLEGFVTQRVLNAAPD